MKRKEVVFVAPMFGYRSGRSWCGYWLNEEGNQIGPRMYGDNKAAVLEELEWYRSLGST